MEIRSRYPSPKVWSRVSNAVNGFIRSDGAWVLAVIFHYLRIYLSRNSPVESVGRYRQLYKSNQKIIMSNRSAGERFPRAAALVSQMDKYLRQFTARTFIQSHPT